MTRLSQICLGVLAVALILGLAMPALAADTKGKIKSVDADKNQFTMTDDNNKNWTFDLAKDGKVFLNDKEGKLADLKVDDQVDIKYEKEGEKLIASEVRAKRK